MLVRKYGILTLNDAIEIEKDRIKKYKKFIRANKDKNYFTKDFLWSITRKKYLDASNI